MNASYRNGLLAGIPLGVLLFFGVVYLLKSAGSLNWMMNW